MFGEGPLIDPEELLTGDVKAKFDATHTEEVILSQTAGNPDPATKTILYPKLLPIVQDFGLDPELLLRKAPSLARWWISFITAVMFAKTTVAKTG